MAVEPPRDDAARLAWLRLARSRNVGPRTFLRLTQRFSSTAQALEALPDLAGGAGLRDYVPATEDDAAREMAAAAQAGARMLCLGANDYPPLLAEIADAPPLLWALGDAALARRPCVAVVGARNASALGRRMAQTLARDLGAAGWVVVSGLARGVDRAAHEAALESGTIAALAGGVDTVYPPENAALTAQIAAQGLLVSEAPMGETPVARSFPKRNRIVSGLSAGVVLVEAAERSGSLITARCAAEQGRESMAVPGSPLDARASGCNALIREGATLIRSAEDVLEALNALRLPRRAPVRIEPRAVVSGDVAEQVAALLGASPVALDALGEAAGLDAATLSAALTELEMMGRIEMRPGDMIALAPPAA